MIKDKIKTLKKLKAIVSSAKGRQEKIVFTNGCFDILHLGHLKYLEQARSLGDKLIVALNSDASVRRLKGKGRPVMPESERASLVAACQCVDYVTVFCAATPLNLIKALKPDVLVKGGNWQKNEIVGGDFVQSYGGRVETLKFVPGYSSSSIIARIRQKR